MKKHVLVAGVAAFLLVTGVQAADQGFFAEIGAGVSKIDLPSMPATVSVDDQDTAFSIGVGYSINKMFAVEAGYTDLGEASLSATGGSVSESANGWYVGPRLSLPLTNNLDAYARVGMLAWNAKGKVKIDGDSFSAKDDGTDIYFGVGAAWNISDTTSVGVDWTRYKFGGDGDSLDVDVIAAKLKFKF